MTNEKGEMSSSLPDAEQIAMPTSEQETIISPRRRVSRRGFLGQTSALLASAVAGLWSLANPKRARASVPECPILPLNNAMSTGSPNAATCGSPPPPPPPDYTSETTTLIENLVANFNAHNTSAITSVMNTSTINTTGLTQHLNTTFSSCPKAAMTINSLVIGPYGYSATLEWTMESVSWQVLVEDGLLDYGSTTPEIVDSVSGTTTFVVAHGSLIDYFDSTHNIVTVFNSHGVTVL